jgi:hypothetical protein
MYGDEQPGSPMRRTSILIGAILVSLPAFAGETIVCSYRAYPIPGHAESKVPVVLHILLTAEAATVVSQQGDIQMPAEPYRVLENNKVGVVLARPMSEIEGDNRAVGAFLIAIDRKQATMTTDSVFVGEEGESRPGTCVFLNAR